MCSARPTGRRLCTSRSHLGTDLRHTSASILIHDGASALVVQRRLGHSDATTTLRVDGHLYPSADAALADALAAISEAGKVVVLDRPRSAAA
jgi:integrase